MSHKDEIPALLSAISLLKDDLGKLNNDLNRVRQDITSIEKVTKAMLSEGGRADPDRSDVKVGVALKTEDQTDRVKNVLDIIRELETEEGPVHTDMIVERASEHGFDKNTAEAEIARLDSEAWIYESARSSGVYRTTMR